MNFAKSTLALLTIGTLCCSIALAKPIRGTGMIGPILGFGIDANGNQVIGLNPEDVTQIYKGIKFPKSGVIINRIKQANTINLSGKRQVTRGNNFFMFDPELDDFIRNVTATRDRFVYPKGKARKNNLVTARFLTVHNPKKVPAEN